MEIVQKSPPIKTVGRRKKYPFQDLKPGDCLEISNVSIDDYKRIHSAAYAFRKRENYMHWLFTVRMEQNKVSVYRLK